MSAAPRCATRHWQRPSVDLWRWPDGHVLTLYSWSWHLGGKEFDHGWSTTDQLDAAGYVAFLAPPPMEIRLDLLAHQPVIERRCLRATDELPSELRERVRIEIPGIWYNRTLEQYQSYPDVTLIEEVGTIPCAWVRARIAATTESPT